MLPSEKYDYEFLKVFEEICRIPHGSGNTKQIAQYCIDYAKNCGFDGVIDEAGNVVIKKPAVKGYENSETVIIQGHTDMVCEKSPYSNHDFTKDALQLQFDGKFLSAKDTTLGADDGIAVAYALALLKTDKPMPALELLLTNDEEIGLNGASGLNASLVKGRKLVNIDSEDEGVMVCGCAGGLTCSTTAKFETISFKGKKIKLSLTGLLGGHSGVQIHKRRLNAIVTVANLLKQIKNDFSICSFDGVGKRNVIPCVCFAEICVDSKDAELILEKIDREFENIVLFDKDEKPELKIEVIEGEFSCISKCDTQRIISYLCNIPDGLMKEDEHGPVTSLNTGVSTLNNNGEFYAEALIRSSINNDMDVVFEQLKLVASDNQMTCQSLGKYPAWEYRNDSILRKIMIKTYEEYFKKEPKVDVLHAGLECGILCDKLDGLDAVSIGPQMYGIHTVEEKLDIPSAINYWNYLLLLLEELV